MIWWHCSTQGLERKMASIEENQEFKVSTFEQRLMKTVTVREGKVKIFSETETEYETDAPEGDASQAPEIVQPLKDFRLMEGNDVTFVAKVIGNPRPKVSF